MKPREMQRTHQSVQMALGQHDEVNESDDGLELGACYLNPDKDKLTFAGSRVQLSVVSDGVTEIKGTQRDIGYRGIPRGQSYEETDVALKPGMTFCMSSDGYLDQVGGNRRRMFGKRWVKELLRSLHGKSVAGQKDVFRRTLLDYQGAENRRDDVSVVALRV